MTRTEFNPSYNLVGTIIAAVHLYVRYTNHALPRRECDAARRVRDMRNARALIFKSIDHLVRPKLRATGGRRTDALFERVYLAGWAEAANRDELVRTASQELKLRLRPRFHRSTKRPHS